MSSEIGGGWVEASEELILVDICVGFAGPGVQEVVDVIFELNWETELVADVV